MKSSKLLLWIMFAYCFITIFEIGLPAVIISGIALFMVLNYTLVRQTHLEEFNEAHNTQEHTDEVHSNTETLHKEEADV
ncbi:hypothetical protein GCM10007358_16520 [Phocicoccus schoeneichii]|uniref:Uncharacterized protein n=1 Tax=Phocicoccus schoeneichii TaxID=1812261 RepID=A0A6V7RQ14_9BACL|nr:hypothetical protein [Jeotgalicoccus schoeneichii]GGH55287.1 hypothetical protein GCM10007358_16520 [Jeotgalicoccus schoeneichii]CAD2079783.1 hypothetical protein JEOSCH030_01710 [Jeotgalicoccus schoeneichii]